ncbi:MAG: PaaI family thioesterase [Gammaproteobacteria bacterium]
MSNFSKFTPEFINNFAAGTFPAYLGIEITHVGHAEVNARLEVQPHLLAPNGYLHAGSIVALADTAAGFGCYANLPHGATSFTTVELKSNHLGTARDGAIVCVAKGVHMGQTTQVWDATVSQEESGKTIALFRCTQILLFPR